MLQKRSICGFSLAAFAALLMPACAASYGDLAAGSLNISEQSGVRAEICRDHLLEPAALPGRRPDGYRLITAREAAQDEPGLAALIAPDPALGDYAVGSLCFMSVENYDVDGVRVIPVDVASPMAFWWVRAERTGKADPRMQGRSQWVQIASWYAIEGTDHRLILAADPTADFVPLEVLETAPGTWHVQLQLADQVVEGTVNITGPGKKRSAAEPGFMTVAYSGAASDYFTVFTYFGHHHSPATGAWTARGKGTLVNAFQVPGEAAAFATYFQSEWQARAALYKIAP